MTGGDDPTLRERFAALRAEETQGAPSFGSVRARRPAARPNRRRRAFAMAAAAAAIVFGFLVLRPEPRPGFEQLSITEWRSPTAFLLENPAASLLQATPAVGERWVMVP
ncbi:MAG TPA: hypothetical protein VJ691_13400 [Vicinamibacterales bacterium]|nr:hypothetical protein [Vicinamibacterales bacterium]